MAIIKMGGSNDKHMEKQSSSARRNFVRIWRTISDSLKRNIGGEEKSAYK